MEPTNEDRAAADEILERLLGKPAIKSSSWEKDVADLAQFHADARAAGAAEMKERCALEVLKLEPAPMSWSMQEHLEGRAKTPQEAAAAIRALK